MLVFKHGHVPLRIVDGRMRVVVVLIVSVCNQI